MQISASRRGRPANKMTTGRYKANTKHTPRTLIWLKFKQDKLGKITMIETMRIANYLAPSPMFSWDIISFDGPEIVASNGMTTTVATDHGSLGQAQYVFVLGSWGTEHYANPALLAWLRKRARAGETICGVELGSYIVARAGLLDGLPATIHWSWLSGFRESFDRVALAVPLFE